MLSRDEAFSLVTRNISKKNIVYHMIAVEAIMKNLAKYFGEAEDLWAATGLLHDIDLEKVGDDWKRHGILAGQILKDKVPEEVLRAIKAHNFEHTETVPHSRMENGLICCDSISGLLVACALVMPSKKLADVTVETVTKKFKAKDFARGADRERILFCEKIGVPKEKFFDIALNGLKNFAKEINL